MPEYIVGGMIKEHEVSFENTVLFYITSFQYLMTSLAFSIARPFKKPIYTNTPLMISILIVLTCDVCLLLVPPSNRVFFTMFHDLSFEKGGVTYYNYKWLVFAGVVLNSLITFVAEKCIVKKVQAMADKRKHAKNIANFHQEMQEF